MARKNKSEATKYPISVAEVLRRRHTERKYDELRTGVGDAVAIVEQGTRPEMSMIQLGKYARLAARVHPRKLLLQRREKIQEQQKNVLKDAAQNNEGFVGIRWPGKLFSLLMSRVPDVKYSRPGLLDVLGDAYPAVVQERLEIGIRISPGIRTEKGPLTADVAKTIVRDSFLAAGMTEKQLDTIVSTEIIPEPNERTLWDMVSRGQISEADVNKAGTATYTWSLSTEVLGES